jgi:hypothetical protein
MAKKETPKKIEAPKVFNVPMIASEVQDLVTALNMLIQNDKLDANSIASICDYKKSMMDKFAKLPGLLKKK